MLKKRQQGFTLITWMLIFSILAFLGLFAIKLVPVYIEGLNVQASLTSLAKDPSSGDSASDLLTKLIKRLDINNVDHVAPEDILIERQGTFYKVSIEYVRQVHFIANIDFLVNFDYQEQVPAR